MTSNPVVPLAVVHARDGIVAARACCETWGRSGEQWVAVDGWGRNLGVVHVAGATINTATGCHELRWKKGDAAQQGKLFFAGSDYISRSFKWTPSAEQLRTFEAFAEASNRLLPRPEQYHTQGVSKGWRERVRFFRALRQADSDDRFAVLAGPALVVANWTEERGWGLVHIEGLELYASPFAGNDAFSVTAIVDLDGDDRPEIVAQRSAGATWEEVVLEQRQGSAGWRPVVTSVGGASL